MSGGEDRVIATIAAACPGAPPPAGIGDDAALVEPGRIVTTDAMVEGVHFDERLDAGDVGWKLVAVNVSDIGAMGGRPDWATLAISVPEADERWLRPFAEGMGEALRRWGVTLVGGDTTRSPGPRFLSLTVGGTVRAPVTRSGGRPGDLLAVTGPLGRAAAAFFSPRAPAEARAWFRRPAPPVATGAALADAGLVSAMMDLSDGLARDLARMCAASACGAEVAADAVPGEGPAAHRLAFGEDYELLVAFPPERRAAVASAMEMHGSALHVVGRLTEGSALLLDGRPDWPPPLFDHFPSRRG